MQNKRLFQSGACVNVIILLLILLIFPFKVSAGDKVYRMKIQSGYPHGDLSTDLLTEFAASADKRSNGQLKMRGMRQLWSRCLPLSHRLQSQI